MMLILFSSGGKIVAQLFIKTKFTTDINEFSQLKMAHQLPLNEISQSNLSEKELVAVIVRKV